MVQHPEAFDEEKGLFKLSPLNHQRTAVGDIVTFESWCTIHCNPLPKVGETRKVIFWYSYEKKVVDWVDPDFQLNPWSLHSLVHKNFESSMVRFSFSFIKTFLIFSPRPVQFSWQHGLLTSPTATSRRHQHCCTVTMQLFRFVFAILLLHFY